MAKNTGEFFPHQVVDRTHPLVKGVNTRFDIPHSRYNGISEAQFENAGSKSFSC